jgi:hypothetical protein
MIADSTPVIRNSTIGANTAGSGGGTYITAGSTVTIEDCTIDKNSSDGGAGIYVYRFNSQHNAHHHQRKHLHRSNVLHDHRR